MNAGDRVTPLVLTFNEEPNLDRSLASLGWARRVVVLDSGSTDRTEEIARSYANVSWHFRPFDSFQAQTDHGLRETGIESDYVLALDADMAVPAALVEELHEHFLAGDYAGGLLAFRYSYSGRALRGSVYPAQIRLFRRDAVRVTQHGHGHKFAVAGPIYSFEARLEHDDRKSLERWVASQLGYSAEELDRLHRGEGLRLRDRLRRAGLMPPLMFVVGYLSAGGPLAGWAALRYAYERATYEGLLALRLLRERREGRDPRGDA
jgi:glycosyltransferase involved in cell wall biosynthesis